MSLYFGIFFMSLTGLFAKSIPLDATSITQLRSVVAIGVLFLFCRLTGAKLKLASWKQTLGIYGIGVIMAIHWITYFHAMQVSSVAIGMLSLYCYPVITVLLEPLFHKKAPKKSDLIAAFILFSGVIILTLDGLGKQVNTPLIGAAWGVLSAFTFSLRNIIQKYQFPDVPSGTLIFHQVVLTAGLLVFFVDFPEVTKMTTTDWLLILALGVFCSSLAHTLVSTALKHLPAKSVAQIGCIQPVLGAIWAWWILDETLSLSVMIGGAIILCVALWESYKQSQGD